jgi:tetratricopeptide (TPR) repeat protein
LIAVSAIKLIEELLMHKAFILFSFTFFLAYGIQAQISPTVEEYLKKSIADIQIGNSDAALTNVNAAIKLNSTYVDAYYLRASIYEKQGDIEKALSDYNKIIELEPNGKGIEIVYSNRATIYLKKGESVKAIEDFNKAAAIAPNSWQIYNQRAIAKLQKGDIEDALADYEKSIDLQPNLPSLSGRGSLRYQKNDFEGALKDLNRALAINNSYGLAYILKGIVYGLQGDLDKSIANFKKGFLLDSKLISEVNSPNFKSSFQNLNQYIAKNPNNARAYEVRGIFRLLQKKETEAEQDFNKALELDSSIKNDIKMIKKEFNP